MARSLSRITKTGAITPRIKFYIPKFSMPNGGNFAAIASNSPHPAAAAVFLNWLIQADTQKALNAQFGSSPMNKQVPPTITPTEIKSTFFGREYNATFKKEFVRNVMMK